MADLQHECGIAALYYLPDSGVSPLTPHGGPNQVSRLMPRVLLDLQNRGQLAAGFTAFNPQREQILDTYKQIGTVIEAFRLNHPGKAENIQREFAGRAAIGHMVAFRDPKGIRPLCYAIDGPLFAAASESVALRNLGFGEITSLEPGEMVVIQDGRLRVERYAPRQPSAHCFFEWIYFANVASVLDDRSVYLTRSRLGEALAEQERALGLVPLDSDTIVVPVPDTGKAAADAMAYKLGLKSAEGLMRNRYVGRTFIEGENRADRARLKYTPLREVLEGKRVLLIEDTIVRSTTLKSLLHHVREQGEAKEVHVRVACPPIVAPCFYGIDRY